VYTAGKWSLRVGLIRWRRFTCYH